MSALRVVRGAFVALSVVMVPLPAWCADGPLRFPGPGEGYLITKPQPDSSQAAPSGYEGRTDTSTLLAVGNTPATTGKTFRGRFTLGNEIKICPQGDGTTEGKGVFSVSLDYTDKQATGTSSLHIEMKADGKYTGQVGDDAWIINPVKADIDYTYVVTGSIRDSSGALVTPAGSNIAQHITIPIIVPREMAVPGLGAFSGGDPAQARYAEAAGAGQSLAYWAGVYYSVAQLKWRDRGRCVNAILNPPSHTVRLVPGGKTTVDAEIKTKGGESVKARFFNARVSSSLKSVAVNDGSVTPAAGSSDVGAPLKFTFTAPTQKVDFTAFNVSATSRAGIAEANWVAGLGTDWNGQISFTITNSGDQGGDELQSWSASSATRVTVDVKDGKGTATGFTEVHDTGRQRQRALRGGAITLINTQSHTVDGSFEDSSPATVDVVIVNPATGTYGIRVNYAFKEGKAHRQSCIRTECGEKDEPMVIGPSLPGISGTMDTPNRLSGSKTETRTGTGSRGTGTVKTDLTWTLAREGTTQ